MTPEQFQQVEQLFDAASRLPAEQRDAFVARQALADPEVLATVRGLLAQDGRATAAADALANKLAAARQAREPGAPRTEGPGTRIGPYELRQQLGEGGFGVVFLAVQEQPVARQVALKIIKLGMDTRQVVARFEQERQALALMDHPNIARVLDAGATDTGRPYFVMDLVQGKPIADYCDAHNLPIDERLALFAQVCSAVQHAHGKGIIHRDIKPSNVLVATHDGKPLAKVIDFGIAKATSSKLTDKTLFTEHLQIIGTLQYMSPEQAAGSLDIDTRTDVYSLGVLLYELLTGSTPFDSKTLNNAMFGEVQRLIREVDPPRPSTRVSTDHGTLASVAACRRVEPKRLGTLIRGELDWIVMRALEKDRGRRYSTAEGLAADIRRYLGGEAVMAAPPSATYRVRKFVRRNRGLVAGIAAVALALLVGVVGFAWQADLAQRERDVAITARQAEAEQRRVAEELRQVAEQERGHAQTQQRLAEANAAAELRERKRAEAISRFVVDALQSADPNYGGKQGLLVSEAMQKAAAILDERAFAGEPDIEASLRSTIADILYRNARARDALPIAERALALYEQVRAGDHRDVANTLSLVATIHQELGDLDAAEPLFVRALAMQRRLQPGDHQTLAKAINNAALLHAHRGRAAEAEALFAEALAMHRRLYPQDDPELAMSINNLATARDALGQTAAAVALYEEALGMFERLFDEHPRLAMALLNLGNTRIGQGRLVEAEQLLERALAMYQKLFAGDHQDTGRALTAVGNIRKILGRVGTAEPMFVQALEMTQRLFPGAHPLVASCLRQLAQLRQEAGRYAEAEPALAQVLAMQRRLCGGDHPEVARAIDQLASVLRDQKRDAEAEVLLGEAVAMQQRLFGAEHPSVASAMHRLASARTALGRVAEAEELSRRALAITRKARPADHIDVAVGLAYLGHLLLDTDRAAAAEPLFAEAVEICRRIRPADHYDTAVAVVNLARAQQRAGKPAEARRTLDEGIAMHRRRTPLGSTQLARALWVSGSARLEGGDPAAAVPELEEAEAIGTRLLAAEHPRLAEYRATLARCRAALGK